LPTNPFSFSYSDLRSSACAAPVRTCKEVTGKVRARKKLWPRPPEKVRVGDCVHHKRCLPERGRPAPDCESGRFSLGVTFQQRHNFSAKATALWGSRLSNPVVQDVRFGGLSRATPSAAILLRRTSKPAQKVPFLPKK
jgi:hypothetical protein